jgi:hypothetical protein
MHSYYDQSRVYIVSFDKSTEFACTSYSWRKEKMVSKTHRVHSTLEYK